MGGVWRVWKVAYITVRLLYNWYQYQWRMRLVICTDCLLWLRHRGCLVGSVGAYGIHSEGSWPIFMLLGCKDGPLETLRVMPEIVSHIDVPAACCWNPPCCFGFRWLIFFLFPSTFLQPSFYPLLSSKWTSSVNDAWNMHLSWVDTRDEKKAEQAWCLQMKL